MLHDMEEHIEPRQDDVRAQPLPATARPVSLGRDRLAGGIVLCHSTDADLADAAVLHVRSRRGHTIPTTDPMKK